MFISIYVTFLVTSKLRFWTFHQKLHEEKQEEEERQEEDKEDRKEDVFVLFYKTTNN